MTPISRRSFLVSSATIVAAGRVASAAAANDKLGVAVIGVNGMGNAHVGTLMDRSDVQLVSICDVDESVGANMADKVQKRIGQRPAVVGDFRRVLDDPNVDAVVVAAPHHWHMPIAARALVAGKDVYLEKPASHVFQEGRVLVDLAKRHNRIVQHGIQMRSSPVTAKAAKVLASGILGTIRTTKAWNVQRDEPPKPVPDSEAPAGVNYDLWLGPAPKRQFNKNRFHKAWRNYRDYGNGSIGDDGIHDLDLARWGLGATTHPVRITAHASHVEYDPAWRDFPDNIQVTYQYADGKVLIYEDRQWIGYGLHGVDSGNAFYGTKGYMIFSRRGFFEVYLGKEEKKGPAMGKEGRVGAPIVPHMANFLDCVRSRKETNAPAESAHLSCALTHLGTIAYRVGRVLHFDPASESFPSDPEANALLTKEYRSPWQLPT